MALDDELIVAELTPFPDGTCWTTPQEFADLLVSHLVLVFNDTAGNSFFNFGPGPIAPENQIYPWLKTDSVTGNPVGWFIFVGGSWKQVPGYPVYYDAAGGPVAFTVTTQEPFSLSTQFEQRFFWIKFPMAPTGAVTINFDTVGPVDIFKNVNQNISGGDWLAGQIVPIVWDASLGVSGAFQLGWPPSTSVYIAGRSSVTLTPTATVLTAADTLVASSAASLTLPAGMSWRWIKVSFSTAILGPGLGAFSSVGGLKIKIGATTLALAQDPAASVYFYAHDDDMVMLKFTTEGQPTGFEATTPLTVDVYASYSVTFPNGDEVAFRSGYIIGEYGP